jgi:hypothetical protein
MARKNNRKNTPQARKPRQATPLDAGALNQAAHTRREAVLDAADRITTDRAYQRATRGLTAISAPARPDWTLALALRAASQGGDAA